MEIKKEPSNKALEKKVQVLIDTIEKIHPSTRKHLMRSFLQGLFTALGATIGLSIALALITYILAQLELIPGLNYLIKQSQIQRIILPSPSL